MLRRQRCLDHSGLDRSYPLDCYIYQSTCGAKKTINTINCSRPLSSGNKDLPKRGDIQCIGHWDQENGSKVRFSMHWTLLVDQKFDLFEFSLNIQLFLSPRSRAFLTIVVCRLRWRCDLPGSISEQYLQLQFELTLNQLMCTCISKSTLLTITCPNLDHNLYQL